MKCYDKFCAEVVPLLVEKRARLIQEAKEEADRLAEEKARLLRTLDGLKGLSSVGFEEAVGSLFAKRGWTVHVTPTSGDGGIDLVILRGKQRVAVQCKLYNQKVGASIVREFYGSFVGRYNYGILVTTATFTVPAQQWARSKGRELFLVDGGLLTKLMVETQPSSLSEFPLWNDGKTSGGRRPRLGG